LKLKKTFPLDYIVVIPPNFIKERSISRHETKLNAYNVMKNFVFRRIIEIRISKKKPKLNDLMKIMKKKDLSNPKTREEFKIRILSLYDDS